MNEEQKTKISRMIGWDGVAWLVLTYPDGSHEWINQKSISRFGPAMDGGTYALISGVSSRLECDPLDFELAIKIPETAANKTYPRISSEFSNPDWLYVDVTPNQSIGFPAEEVRRMMRNGRRGCTSREGEL